MGISLPQTTVPTLDGDVRGSIGDADLSLRSGDDASYDENRPLLFDRLVGDVGP